jgi:hypothetical protein
MLFSKPSPAGTTSPSSGNCGSWNSAKSSLPVGTGARCSATRCCWGPSPCKTWIWCCDPGEPGQVGRSLDARSFPFEPFGFRQRALNGAAAALASDSTDSPLVCLYYHVFRVWAGYGGFGI